jgi:hypothetical protein
MRMPLFWISRFSGAPFRAAAFLTSHFLNASLGLAISWELLRMKITIQTAE